MDGSLLQGDAANIDASNRFSMRNRLANNLTSVTPGGNRNVSNFMGSIELGAKSNGNQTGKNRGNDDMGGRGGFDKTGAPVNYIMEPEQDEDDVGNGSPRSIDLL